MRFTRVTHRTEHCPQSPGVNVTKVFSITYVAVEKSRKVNKKDRPIICDTSVTKFILLTINEKLRYNQTGFSIWIQNLADLNSYCLG